MGARASMRRASAGLPRLLAAGCVVLSACAYSFSGSSLPSHVNTIGIPSFGNESELPGLGQDLTAGVTDRFISDGRLKIASSGNADARLEGEIIQYENKVNTFSAAEEPIDYVVVIALSVRLRDQVKNRELWSRERLTASSVWAPNGTGIATEEQAREEAIETLASDIITTTLEQW